MLDGVNNHVGSDPNRQEFKQQDQGQAQEDERDRNLDQDKFQESFQRKILSKSAKETKFIDITLDNTYTSTVRYAMYYNLLNHKKLPDNVTISLAEDSPSRLEDTIKSGENKVISIKIVNNSDDNLELVVGSVVGFENGNVADLLKENEVLIK